MDLLPMKRVVPMLVVAIAPLGVWPLALEAQEEKPVEAEPAQEQVMLQDFGSGLRVAAWALSDSNLDLKEIWQAAADAIYPEKADLGMELYLADYESNQQMAELDVFRDELKNNVMNGSMSRDEALAAWVEVMDVRFFHDFKGTNSTEWTTRLKESADRGLLGAVRLRIPDAGDVRVLTRPEYLARDLQYFSRELELDEETRSIIKLLLEDYVRTYEARSAELKDAIRSARGGMARSEMRDRVVRARANMNELVDSIDWDQVRSRVAEEIEDGDRQVWMTEAIGRFQGSVGEVRRAIESRQRELDQDSRSYADPSEVLELAADLQQDRVRMRADLIEGMRLVLDDQQQDELDRIFDRFVLEQARTDSRMGGSGINLELALEDSVQNEAITEQDRALLDEATIELLELTDRWTNSRIDRERSGLELFVAYQGDNESSKDRLTRIHAGRARSELEAEVAIRDRLLAGQMELEESLHKTDPLAALKFREFSTRQGFAPQMRQRWSERAIASALSCEELADDQRELLEEYEVDVVNQLGPLRIEAIRKRVSVEPRIARSKIDAMTGKKSSQSLGLEGWQEPGAAAFRNIDKDVSEQLTGMFEGMACIEVLPRRRGDVKTLQDDSKSAAGKAGAKDEASGKKGDTGKGRGRGRR